jgi:hypothetical protein
MKGKTSNFSLYHNFFTLNLLNGEVITVNIEKMKAAFIVKSFDGNNNHTYTYKDKLPFGGTKVKIEFIDGEVMIGYNPYDVYGHHGFFLHPADMMGNNKCVFAVTTAIKKLSFL